MKILAAVLLVAAQLLAPRCEACTLYHAAALFNAREKAFNIELTRSLEQAGYRVLLPQRDGFEFVRLDEALARHLPPAEVPEATRQIIYLLDVGWFVAQSDAVVANLDEPVDEGVVVEITRARGMGKPVLCFRTDDRSPFGSPADDIGGVHFFVSNQCDSLIRTRDEMAGVPQAAGRIEALRERLDAALASPGRAARRAGHGAQGPTGDDAAVTAAARLLFHGLERVNSPQAIRTVVRRYLQNRQALRELAPTVLAEPSAKPVTNPSIPRAADAPLPG